jgi:hypothetical protein
VYKRQNLTGARRWSFPDRSDTVAGLGAQTFTGVQACAAQLYVRGASIGALGVATASETAPQSVASWDATKHVILGGAASATNSAACGIMFNQTNSEFSLVSLTPGISWNNIALRCATFGVFPSGAATAAFSVAAGAGDTSITSTTDATSTTAAALVVSGGVGIAKQLRVGGNVTAVNGSSSVAAVYVGGASANQGWLQFGTAADYGIQGGADYVGLVFRTNGASRMTIGATGIVVCSSSLEVNSATLIKSNTTLTNGAAAAAGTLTNAPAAGNPTKWIPINDNGTTRYLPAW